MFSFKKILITSLFSLWVVLGVATPIFAAPISATYNTASFLDLDLDADLTKDQINWKPTNGTVVSVTDTAVTGMIWGETVGWINLNPSRAGITNTCSGILSGYAWGQNTGWINFNPTRGGVTINTTTGDFSGYAWSQNYGWIHFDPNVSTKHVQTDWHGCTVVTPPGGGGGSVPPVDLCTNLAGMQTVVPSGYVAALGICTPIVPISSYACSDLIDNDGDGLIDFPNDAGCSSPTDTSEYNLVIDQCPNMAGIQLSLSSCPVIVTPPIDPADPLPPSGLPLVKKYPIDKITNAVKQLITTNTAANVPFAGIATILALLGLMGSLPGFLVRLGNIIYTIPFIALKKPWGIVYDAESKEPLDPAIVVIINADTGEEIDQRTTDMEGRYGFALKPGNYKMVANKTHYRFPSQLLAGQTSDIVYKDLYFGEVFTINEDNKDQVLTLNIPMDKIGEDWNETEKKNRRGLLEYFTHNKGFWYFVFKALFVSGFITSMIILYFSPNTWNTIIASLYILLGVLSIYGLGGVHLATITKDGKPLRSAIVRVFSAKLNIEIAHRITNENGNYYILVPNGEYYITVEQKNGTGGYDKVYTGKPTEIHGGIINENITL